MADFNLEEEGIEVQALLDKVQTPDSAPTQNSSSLVTSGGVYDALQQKQQKLTFDLVPTEGSNNPVKSDGIYSFVQQNVAEQIEDLQPIVIEGNVDNAPDEEDLTSVDQSGTDVLKFKNKSYAPLVFSGKGRTYLRKNITGGKNVLTSAMIADANTIYHIQYDYDLNEQTITIPSGCILLFEGGSISNGTLVGSNTLIQAPLCKIFENVTIDNSGSWDVDEAYPEWFGDYGLWTDTENLYNLSNTVRLTQDTYWSNGQDESAPSTLRVKGRLISDCNSNVRIVPSGNDFIGIQLGDPNGSLATRENALGLYGIRVYLHTLANAERTAVLGISYTQRAEIENCSFYNSSNARQTALVKSVVNNPSETLNYGVLFFGDASGSSEFTTFINCGITADLCVYFKNEADFVNFYNCNLICGEYGYGCIYGQQVTNLGLYNTDLNRGIRSVHIVTLNPQKDATSSLVMSNCRVEQLNNNTIADDVEQGDAQYMTSIVTIDANSTNSSYTYNVLCSGCTFAKGTKLTLSTNRLIVCKYDNCVCLYSDDDHAIINVANATNIILDFVNNNFRGQGDVTVNSNQLVENLVVTNVSTNVYWKYLSNLKIYNYGGLNRRKYGTVSQKPTMTENFEIGFMYYVTNYKTPCIWNGTEWKGFDGLSYGMHIGATTQRPALTVNDTGYSFYDTTLKRTIFAKSFSGSAASPVVRWADALGRRIDTEVYGSTRPTGWGANDIGQMFFDTALGKPIFWNGTAWVDSSGATV